MSIAPLTKQANISNREARPPLTRPSGPFFLALESFLGILGAWVSGCGDSGAEAEVALGIVAQHKEAAAAMGGIRVGTGRKGTRTMAKPFFRDGIFTFF